MSFIYVSHLSSMFSHWIVNLEMLIFLMDALIYSGLSCSIHPVITFIFYVYVYFFVASAPTFSEAREFLICSTTLDFPKFVAQIFCNDFLITFLFKRCSKLRIEGYPPLGCHPRFQKQTYSTFPFLNLWSAWFGLAS